MGLFVNCLAVVFSTVIVSCGISYFAREKNAGCLRYYMLIMGLMGALWSGGFGIMGFTETAEQAEIFRAVGVTGVAGFMMTEALMVAYMIRLPKWLFRTYVAAFGLFIARSARTFLLRPTFCFASLPMNWEYDMPYERAAALILWIQSERNSRFLALRSRYA